MRNGSLKKSTLVSLELFSSIRNPQGIIKKLFDWKTFGIWWITRKQIIILSIWRRQRSNPEPSHQVIKNFHSAFFWILLKMNSKEIEFKMDYYVLPRKFWVKKTFYSTCKFQELKMWKFMEKFFAFNFENKNWC